jgi:hypothetical protein
MCAVDEVEIVFVGPRNCIVLNRIIAMQVVTPHDAHELELRGRNLSQNYLFMGPCGCQCSSSWARRCAGAAWCLGREICRVAVEPMFGRIHPAVLFSERRFRSGALRAIAAIGSNFAPDDRGPLQVSFRTMWSDLTPTAFAGVILQESCV